jgi:hypothetical protein
MHRVASVEADSDTLKLTLRWKNGSVTVKDLRRDIERRPAFAMLRDPKRFRRVRVRDHGYAIAWPKTGVELAADALWYDAHPSELPFPDEVMTAPDFRHWMGERGFSLSAAAEVLGLSRRAVAYYASGSRRIPRLVFLACMALAASPRKRKAA